MIITTNEEKLKIHIYDVMHLFYKNNKQDEGKPFVNCKVDFANARVYVSLRVEEDENNIFECKEIYEESKRLTPQEKHKLLVRKIKFFLYSLLKEHKKMSFPYGCLTGVNPTRVAYDLLNEGVEMYMLHDTICQRYGTDMSKARLIREVVLNQKSIIRNDKLVNLYINIPFCPTRCKYCSFTDVQFTTNHLLIPLYLDVLFKEIEETKKMLQKNYYIVRTIYIGGGTPTVLSAEQLDLLLDKLAFPVSEITVECGRPDTITKEKLDVLKKHGVTRISINPQSFVDATLKRVGRNHTARDVISAYKIALPYNFQVNMDLIAGLEKDSLANFKRSLNTTLMLAPDNITVHTLSVKRAAEMTDENVQNEQVCAKMMDYAREKLKEEGYKAYYMYRQKNQLQNLENVGFYKEKVCMFNIDSMEDALSTVAVGAGAISKRIFSLSNKIERQPNPKNVQLYIDSIESLIEQKTQLFEKKD